MKTLYFSDLVSVLKLDRKTSNSFIFERLLGFVRYSAIRYSIHPIWRVNPLSKTHSPFKKGDSTFKKGEWKGENGDSPFERWMKLKFLGRIWYLILPKLYFSVKVVPGTKCGQKFFELFSRGLWTSTKGEKSFNFQI